MQLSHKDVYLGYFAYIKREIDTLYSGIELTIQETGCFSGKSQVLKFSSKFREQINGLKNKKYSPTRAIIRHIVFWQGKDEEKETKIILPDLEFQKTT